MRELLGRLRHLVARRKHAEVDEELAFHLEQQELAYLADGMSPKEARRRALIDFGGVERTREECREVRPGYRMETLAQDVKYALRGFRRSPVFTLTVVLTLMLGIGATTAVFSVVDRILFRPLPYADADRLVSLGMVQSLETQEFMLGRFYYDWRDAQKAFVSMTSETAVTSSCELTDKNPAQLSCPRVEQNFLPTFGVEPVLGRNFLPEEGRAHGPKVGMISYGLWLSHYNLDPAILNKTIEIDGAPLLVIGVLPRSFEMPRLQAADVLLPMAVDEVADRLSNQGLGGPRRVFARLKPGVSVVQAYEQMLPLFLGVQKLIPANFRSNFHLRVRSLRDRQMQDVRLMAWILLGTVVSVLMIACANVASLLMARGAMRQRELAVRSALGASRARLVCQALTEALLLSLAGAVAGCLLAEGLLHVFLAIAPLGIPYLAKAQLDGRVIGFTVLLAVLCGVLFGLVPALQRPRRESLTGRSPSSLPHATLRQWLVVGQIAASMILLAGAMLLLRSYRNVQNQHLGMRADNTLTISVTLGSHRYPKPQDLMAFFQRLQQQLQFGPGVTLVAETDTLPPGANHNSQRYDAIRISGHPFVSKDPADLVTYRRVSPEYFHALDISLLQGEGFSDAEVSSSERFLVLSQKLAGRLFPATSPLGERLQLDDSNPNVPWYTIVGVAADVKNSGLTAEEQPEYYRLRRNRAEDWSDAGVWGRTAVVVVRTSLPAEQMTPWIRDQIAKLDPTLPVDIATLQQRVSKLADQPRFQTLLVGFFAATGVALALIGLYGVMSFLVAQRTQEIGVRMALGASRGDVLGLVMRRSLKLIVGGIGLGLIAGLAASRVLSSLLFNVGSHDPVTFVAVTALLFVVAVAATLFPARSATKVDPMVALRCD